MLTNPVESVEQSQLKMTNGPTSEALLLREAPSTRPCMGRIPRWLVLGLFIRLALMPFNHPWELQTWYNMFVDLSQSHSPYETFHDLTASYRSHLGLLGPRESPSAAAPELFYAYYAYPPLLMMLYYPVAMAAKTIVPLAHEFTMHGPAAEVIVPPLFQPFFKLPLFVAEVATAVLLWRLADEGTARRFFLNPLVILVSAAWTVDALATLAVVLSLYLIRREHYLASAAALALGTMVKFLPGVLLPAVLLFLWHRGVSRRMIVGYAGTFIAICVAILAPFWGGFQEVLLFQNARPGANLSGHLVLYALTQFTKLDLRMATYLVSPVIGVVTQASALLLVYYYLTRRIHTLTQMSIITLLAFMLGSKVVNEPYLYVLVPLLALELAEHPNESTETVFKLLYAVPLAFAFVNVPVIYFAAPFYRFFWRGNYPVTYDWGRAFPLQAHAVVLILLACAFIASCVYAVLVIIREGEHGQGVVAAC